MHQNIILSLCLLGGCVAYSEAQTTLQDIYTSEDAIAPYQLQSNNREQQTLQLAGLPFINQSDAQFSQPGTDGPSFSQETNNESFSEGAEFQQPVTEGPEFTNSERNSITIENPGLKGQNFDQPEVNNSSAEQQLSGPPHVIETPVYHPSDRTSEPQNITSDNPDFNKPSVTPPDWHEPNFTDPVSR